MLFSCPLCCYIRLPPHISAIAYLITAFHYWLPRDLLVCSPHSPPQRIGVGLTSGSASILVCAMSYHVTHTMTCPTSLRRGSNNMDCIYVCISHSTGRALLKFLLCLWETGLPHDYHCRCIARSSPLSDHARGLLTRVDPNPCSTRGTRGTCMPHLIILSDPRATLFLTRGVPIYPCTPKFRKTIIIVDCSIIILIEMWWFSCCAHSVNSQDKDHCCCFSSQQ